MAEIVNPTDQITVTQPRHLWHRLMYSASLGVPMYGDGELGEETREAWQNCFREAGDPWPKAGQ